jgi:alpha-1,2-mannosyltransferase
LAKTPQEFADAIEKVLSADDSIVDMQIRARDSVQERFSEKVFEEQLRKCLHEVLSRERVTIYGRKLIDPPQDSLKEENGGEAEAKDSKNEQ